MKKFLALALSMAMLVSALTGCGGSDTPQPDAPASPDSSATPGEVTYRKDITIGINGKIVGTDPQENNNSYHGFLYAMVFDTLLHYSNEKKELEPSLASEWNTEDGQTYSFTIRDDVTFHDGTHMTANDVKWTFERGKTSGGSAALCKQMEEITVVDDTHLTIKLASPNVDFPYLLTENSSSIMCQAAVEADPTNGVSVGCGPWIIDSYEFGNYIDLNRNNEYWGELPITEKITLKYYPETSSRLIAVETGEAQVCQDMDPIEVDRIMNTEGLTVQGSPTSGCHYVTFNCTKAPFDNPDLRNAVLRGIDNQEIIDICFNGLGSTADSTWGWNQFGYNGGTTKYEYDPEGAKAALAELGYNESNPLKFTLSVSTGSREPIGNLIQAQLKKIGVEVELNVMDTAGLAAATTAGDHTVAIYGIGYAAYGDDSRRLLVPGSTSNRSFYSNDRVTELFELAAAETDDSIRQGYYEEIQQIVYEDAPYGIIIFIQACYATDDGVGGIDFYPSTYNDFSYIYCVE